VSTENAKHEITVTESARYVKQGCHRMWGLAGVKCLFTPTFSATIFTLK